MPRKAKDKTNELNNINIEKQSSPEVNVAKAKKAKSTVQVKKDSKENEVTKSLAKTKRETKKSDNSKVTKITTKSKTSTATNSKTTKKAKTSTKKATEKKTQSITKRKSKSKNISTTVEYYDLPFRYNRTLVKILAQTPSMLFIYWDISDDDKVSLINQYGKDFFNNTRPYLIITNETMNYTFEVEINDFANSWYLHVNDANCKYKVELGRKFIVSYGLPNIDNTTFYNINDYVSIASSNEIDSPNNHILFDELGSSVFFRNVKTNFTTEKDISSLSFLTNIGRIYNIYDLYQKMYEDELISDEFGVNLPSSSSSSTFK